MNFIDTAFASGEEQHTEVADSHATETGVAASLGLNGTMFIFQLINFALVAAVLWYLILKPLTKKMTERQNIIDESLNNAKKVQETLQKGEEDYQAKIAQAKTEANTIIAKASEEAEKVAQDSREKTKQEINKAVEQAKNSIKAQKEEMIAGIKSEAAGLIALALEKILAEKMNGEKDKKMIEEAIKTIKN